MPNEFSEHTAVAATSAIGATATADTGTVAVTPDAPNTHSSAFAVSVIEKARASLPQPKDVRALAEFFRIVGNEMRIKILLSLSGGRLRVCDIAAVVETSVSATSHQLGMLRQAHLVKYDKVGKVVYYSLDDEHIEAVFESAIEHVTEK